MGKRRVKRGGNDTDDTTDKETFTGYNNELDEAFLEDDTSSSINIDTNDNILNEEDNYFIEYEPPEDVEELQQQPNGAFPNGGGKKRKSRKSRKSRRKVKKSKKARKSTKKVKRRRRVTKRRRFYGGRPALSADNWDEKNTYYVEPTFK